MESYPQRCWKVIYQPGWSLCLKEKFERGNYSSIKIKARAKNKGNQAQKANLVGDSIKENVPLAIPVDMNTSVLLVQKLIMEQIPVQAKRTRKTQIMCV